MRKLTYLTLVLPLLAACYLAVASAQRFAPGYCPTVTAHENFDKTKFFGNWIEVEKTPSIFDLMMRCLVVDYSDDQDNTVNVVVRGVSLAGLPLTVNGDGLLQDVHRSGFYSIRYGFGVPFQGTLTTIIDTDYDDYAVVYSCTNSLLSGVFHSEYIWVLSRSGKISNPTRQNIYEKLDKLAINRSGLTMSDRSTCPTNSSNVARESDKDLAAQGVGVGLTGPAGSSQSASSGVSGSSSSSSGASGVVNSDGSASPSSAPVANLEKASPGEQSQPQKSVPLLYDLPSPASSSSVGGKPAQVKAPPAPVENKVPQLPLSSSLPSGQQQQQSAVSSKVVPLAAKPQQSAQVPSAQQSAAASAPSNSAQSVVVVSSSGSGSSNKPVSNQQVQQQAAPQQPSQQQQQAQSLLAKIQPKP